MKHAGLSHLYLLVVAFLLACAPVVTSAQSVTSHGHRKILAGGKVSYPKIAQDIRLEGTVRVKVTVAADGTSAKTELIGGSPVFVAPVLDAIKTMRWQPASEETIEVVEVEFHFSQN